MAEIDQLREKINEVYRKSEEGSGSLEVEPLELRPRVRLSARQLKIVGALLLINIVLAILILLVATDVLVL